MNAGFSTLTELKAVLLAEVLREGTDYDPILTSIGLGVAIQFQRQCNRQFQRVEDDTVFFTAGRESFCLPRYPVEEITEIAFQSTYGAGFTAQDLALIANLTPGSGLVRFGCPLSSDLDLVRITYTGGYWWSTTEEGGETLPTNATALPADLLLAWHQQCAAAWDKRDKLGVGAGSDPDKKQTLTTLALLPSVVDTLRHHVRYQMT